MLKASIKAAGYRGGFTLRDINLEIPDGEILVVTGPSGSGKTTLLRALIGVLDKIGGFVEGSVFIDEHNLSEIPPWRIHELIAYIPQEPWYAIVGYTVRSEYCYTLSLTGLKCNYRHLDRLGLTGKLESLTANLSAGETQKLLWAGASAGRTRVLVLDEPLVYLDEETKGIVGRIAMEALENKTSLIVVDHNPYYWRNMPGKLLILDEGVVKYYGEWSDDALALIKPSWALDRRRETPNSSDAAIEVENLWFKYPGEKPLFKGLNLIVERAQLTGLTGRNGSGKSTLLKLMAGMLKPVKGRVKKRGRATYIPENPLLYFTKPTPVEELLYAAGGRLERVTDVAEAFGLSKSLETPLARLSSGERRRLAIASAYLSGFDIYLVDEPTGGLDQWNTVKVLEALSNIVDSGGTVVVATHDERIIRILDSEYQLG
ncbi:MAG: ATP-binding cassette domain-containing protein [Desulfurococcus sp.]|nr:ATP-binding cassette domain-containing protein [Desulfurococcus sp.]